MALLAAGCPSAPVTVTPDSGTTPDDTGRGTTNDTGTLLDAPVTELATCAAPRMITPALGVQMTITGNTAGGGAGPLTMSGCGSMAPTRAPQEVLAIRIPGTGPAGLIFDLTDGTTANFDTVVQVRTTCETDPGAEGCFDDVGEGMLQSAGAIPVMGGTTVYLVVTGFEGGAETVSSGAYSARITVEPNTAPTLTAASAVRIGATRFYIDGTGMDAETNAEGYALQLLNAAGMPISTNPEDATAVGPFPFRFDVAPTSVPFTAARSSIDDLAAIGAGPAAAIASAVTARIIVVDTYGLMSAMRDVAITDVAEVGLGEACDATHVCAVTDECTAGTCQAPAAVRAACMGATALTLVAPTGTTPTVATQAVALAVGDGVIINECGGNGAERLFTVTVPAGGADLIVTTNIAATMMTVDTVVAIRSRCVDASSETVCNDDYEGAPMGDLRSTAVIEAAAAGTYTVIVDSYRVLGAAATASVELRLRPVLAAGAACDPAGVMNRCSTAACPASGAALCPAAVPAG